MLPVQQVYPPAMVLEQAGCDHAQATKVTDKKKPENSLIRTFRLS
jgi:hypothetical protein